ncbi:twin-arginine translocase TatA/TatE family subunit [Holdemania massiliensis]|uniref:twin-arginine translocase TatA/TatE family subunit n=1 Tax=Holdemania massiliensis TaxID=1468449 RepID=UPI0035208AB0
MKIGITEIIVICVIALVVLGPEKLPIYAKKLGASLKEVKKVTGDLSKDIRENIVEPLDEASAPLKEAIEPIVSLKEDVNKSIDDVTKSFKSIGKPAKKEEPKPEVIDAEVSEAGAETEVSAPAEETETPSLAETYMGRKAPRRARPTAKSTGRRTHHA